MQDRSRGIGVVDGENPLRYRDQRRMGTLIRHAAATPHEGVFDSGALARREARRELWGQWDSDCGQPNPDDRF
jgi:hypothetical protein